MKRHPNIPDTSPADSPAHDNDPGKDFLCKTARNSTNSTPSHRTSGGFAPGNPWRFDPGRSGNPGGRPPRSKSFSEVLRARLEQAVPGATDNKSYQEAIADLILKAALSGNIRAINALLDRTDGRPRQTIAIRAPNPLESEEWANLRSTIVRALRRFPEAQVAVLQAIDGQDAQNDAQHPIEQEADADLIS